MSKLASQKNISSENKTKMDSQEGFRALFEFANEGIIVADNNGVIVRVNPSAEKLFGYEHGELIGKTVETLIPHKHAHKHVDLRTNYSKDPHPRSMGLGMDLFAKRKDDTEFPVEVSLSPLNTKEGKFVIAFVIDNSFRKKQEDALKQTNAELEKRVEDRTMMLREAIYELERSRREISDALIKEKELNDLKSRFVTMASHEFRTPLSTILSSASLIAKYNTADAEEKKLKHVDRIKSSVVHLTAILSDLLSLAKLEEGILFNNPESFDIVKFSEELIQDMQGLTKDNQPIIYKHQGASSKVFLDVKFLKQILTNLLSNAIKFSSEGKQIDLITKTDNHEVIIEVTDRGIGIDEKDQKRLFERFFRGQNAENIQGTGLGLNIISKYLELMNGNITFTSKLNEGTTFTIKLPTK
jgi:PAS domain S-box-containing protein